MTTIRVSCELCLRDVQLDGDEVILVTGPSDRTVCAFTCPHCGNAGARALDDAALLRLTLAGVRIVVGEPEAHDAGAPAFTYDDLLDLHRLLSEDTWFAQLQQPLTPGVEAL